MNDTQTKSAVNRRSSYRGGTFILLSFGTALQIIFAIIYAGIFAPKPQSSPAQFDQQISPKLVGTKPSDSALTSKKQVDQYDTDFVYVEQVGADQKAAEQVSAQPSQELQRFEADEIRMAMRVHVALYAPSKELAKRGFQTVFDKFTAINSIMSDYQNDSEMMKLCASAPHDKNHGVKVSNDLFAVLQYGQKLSENSDGVFDMTVGPLTKLWRKSKRSHQLPPPEVLSEAKKLVGYKNIALNDKEKTVALTQSGMQLDAGGIAVGYTVDRALVELRQLGITRAMIDASGDIGCSDAPPGQIGWRIGIAPLNPEAPPSRFLRIANAAITTSGDAYQHITIDGKKYSHIIDPKTGLGLTRSVATSVYAKDCITADALAKTICILGPERGMKLLEKYPVSEAIMLLAKENPLNTQNTQNSQGKENNNKSEKTDIEKSSTTGVEVFTSPGLDKLVEQPTLAK